MNEYTTEPVGLLRRLGDEYRHVEQEHGRQPPSRQATRHRLERSLQDLEQHFERVLAAWVREDAQREQWREYLHGRGAAPPVPHVTPAPLFKGKSDAGTVIEVRPTSDGYDVVADGARIEHADIPWHLDPDMRGPVQIGEHSCEEIYVAPAPAIDALSAFLAGGEPPWRWVRELVEDGLIDAQLALTPRGRRCLDRGKRERIPPARARNVCVLVADAARARVYLLDVDRGTIGPAITELVEVAELTNPTLRARDTELLSDTRQGRRGGAKTPLRNTSDHRDHHRRDLERHFAALVAEEAAGVWRRYPSCELIVIASPVMLGLLRLAIERQIRAKDNVVMHELARDFTKMTPPMLHDRLAEIELLPARGRRSPLVPAPGLPM